MLWLALCCLLGAQCASGPKPLHSLSTFATDDPEAQSDFEQATRAEQQGAWKQAAQLYGAFVKEHPQDRLVPVARLGLGRSLLRAGDARQADKELQSLQSHAHPGIRERSELYHGIALAELGQPNEAISIVLPYLGRAPDNQDETWLETSLLKAAQASTDVVLGLRAFDALAQQASEPTKSEASKSRRERIQNADTANLLKAYQAFDRDSTVWSLVAPRLLKQTFERGEMQQARSIVHDIDDQDILLDHETRRIVQRLQQMDEIDPTKVGVLLPLSGRASLIGQAALRALQLAVSEEQQTLAKRLVIRDTAGDSNRAREAFEDLVWKERVIAVIGPITAAEVVAVAEQAKQSDVPVITLAGFTRLVEASPTLFRLMPSPYGEVSTLVRFATKSGAKRFGILYPDGKYGLAMRGTFAQVVAEQQGSVVFEQSYPSGSTNFKQPAQSLAASGAQAVFIPDTSKAIALIAPTLAAVGLWSVQRGSKPDQGRGIHLLVPHAGFDNQLASLVGRYLQGATFSVPFDANLDYASTQAFVDAYREHFGAEPDVFSAYAYDAYRLIQSGLSKGLASRIDLLRHLTSEREGQTTISAAQGFNANRAPRQETHLVELVGTEFAPISER